MIFSCFGADGMPRKRKGKHKFKLLLDTIGHVDNNYAYKFQKVKSSDRFENEICPFSTYLFVNRRMERQKMIIVRLTSLVFNKVRFKYLLEQGTSGPSDSIL